MRLFVAIDLSDQARAAVVAEQKRLAAALGDGRSSLRWVRPPQLHLTLTFLGEVDEARGPAIVDALTERLAVPVFTIAFGGVGLFPPDGPPRVVWLGVARGARETIEVEREVAGRLDRIGLAREARPFRPHLTLGRWRTSSPADRRRLLAGAGAGEIVSMPVPFVTLYQSRLSPDGPTHTPLVRAALTAEP